MVQGLRVLPTATGGEVVSYALVAVLVFAYLTMLTAACLPRGRMRKWITGK